MTWLACHAERLSAVGLSLTLSDGIRCRARHHSSEVHCSLSATTQSVLRVVIRCYCIAALMLQDTMFRHMQVSLRNKSPDLLQLAMNCSSNTAARAAARGLLETSGDLDRQLTRRLLITAAKRQHMCAVKQHAAICISTAACGYTHT
jgi:hypothetical protein